MPAVATLAEVQKSPWVNDEGQELGSVSLDYQFPSLSTSASASASASILKRCSQNQEDSRVHNPECTPGDCRAKRVLKLS